MIRLEVYELGFAAAFSLAGYPCTFCGRHAGRWRAFGFGSVGWRDAGSFRRAATGPEIVCGGPGRPAIEISGRLPIPTCRPGAREADVGGRFDGRNYLHAPGGAPE